MEQQFEQDQTYNENLLDDVSVDLHYRTALLRALSRAVPFEAFSALGSPCYPWHDQWTDTLVIDEKTSRLPA